MFSIIQKILLALTILFNFALGIIVFLKRRKEANILFTWINFAVALWALAILLYWFAKTPETALFYSKCAYAFAGLIPIFFLRFVLIYPYKSEILTKSPKVNLLLAAVLIIWGFIWANLIVSGVEPLAWGYNLIPAKFYLLYIVYFASYMTFSFIVLFLKLRESRGIEKLQIKYVFTGCILSTVLGSIPNLILPFLGNTKYTSTGPLAALILVIFTAYAIVKYRLMNITLTITRAGVFIAVYSFVLGLPFALMTAGKNWLISILGPNWLIGPLVLMALLSTIGPFLRTYLNNKIEEKLFKEQRRYHEALHAAAKEIVRIHNPGDLLSLIVSTITDSAQIFHVAIYLFDINSQDFIFKAGGNLPGEQPASIEKKSSLISWIRKHREPLVYEELKRKAEDESNPVFRELEGQLSSLNAAVIIPSFLENRLSALLILGDKRSGGIYTSDDLDLFSVLANETALAIENAQLYENIENQVKQRTEELAQVQKQLIQAEKLATVGTLAGGVAHEINNPLTAILTNVQMLLAAGGETDAKMDKESLQLIEEATKRCRTIVQKLMAYSKKPLEAADVNELDLLKVVNNVVALLGYQLEQENIKLIIENRENSYLITGNQNELEQVITNIVLNAKDAIKRIKKSGIINISLLQKGNLINIKIKDDGAGIPKEIINKIFDPFFTTKDVGKGLGLGLSICQAIIEKHNGLITAESEANKGSTFTIQLPKAKTEKKAKSAV